MTTNVEQEFNLKAIGDVLIEHTRLNTYVVATYDIRDLMDEISAQDMYDWKGEEILKCYDKNELLRFIEENFDD